MGNLSVIWELIPYVLSGLAFSILFWIPVVLFSYLLRDTLDFDSWSENPVIYTVIALLALIYPFLFLSGLDLYDLVIFEANINRSDDVETAFQHADHALATLEKLGQNIDTASLSELKSEIRNFEGAYVELVRVVEQDISDRQSEINQLKEALTKLVQQAAEIQTESSSNP